MTRLEKNGFSKKNGNLPVDGCRVWVRAAETISAVNVKLSRIPATSEQKLNPYAIYPRKNDIFNMVLNTFFRPTIYSVEDRSV